MHDLNNCHFKNTEKLACSNLDMLLSRLAAKFSYIAFLSSYSEVTS
jgi:hypothetical protein